MCCLEESGKRLVWLRYFTSLSVPWIYSVPRSNSLEEKLQVRSVKLYCRYRVGRLEALESLIFY